MLVKYSRPGAACHITPATVTVGVAKPRGGAKRQINQAKNVSGTHLILAGVQLQTFMKAGLNLEANQKDPGDINHLFFGTIFGFATQKDGLLYLISFPSKYS